MIYLKYYLVICFSVFFLLFLHTSANYDYLMLSETWPPTFCKSNPCTIVPIPTMFTLHGLWPNNNTGNHPAFCDPSGLYPFDDTDVNNLPHIESHWPDLLKGDNKKFWGNEWMKHGTCSQLPLLEYFELTLELYSKNNIKDILNISRKQCYKFTKSKILSDISKEIKGKNPQLVCTKSGDLLEVRICFDKTSDHKYINCPTLNSCKQQVTIP